MILHLRQFRCNCCNYLRNGYAAKGVTRGGVWAQCRPDDAPASTTYTLAGGLLKKRAAAPQNGST